MLKITSFDFYSSGVCIAYNTQVTESWFSAANKKTEENGEMKGNCYR